MFENLAHVLYELPRKAVSYATLQELGIDGDCSKYLKKTEFLLNGLTRQLNSATKGLDETGIQQYAVGGNEDVASILHLTDYVQSCNPIAKIPELTETAQKVVDYAIVHAQQNGKEIPFFGSPEADLVVMLSGLAIGGSVALYKLATKIGGSKLFPDYSKT